MLGTPDLALITLSELAEQALRICWSCRQPVLIDGDHGYGNALNVTRTVRELEIAGVAALTIEDTLLPAAFGAADEMQLIPLDEAVGVQHWQRVRIPSLLSSGAPVPSRYANL